MDRDFIEKYSPLVTDNICIDNNIDIADKLARALFAYKLLTGEDYATVVPVDCTAYYMIKSDGSILSQEGLAPIATCTDLVEDPIKVAMNIAVKCQSDMEFANSHKLRITKGELDWLASLFDDMHDAMLHSDNVPLIWKLCDYSYKGVSHIEVDDPYKTHSDIYYSFATGYILNNRDVVLNTETYKDYFASPNAVLMAYMREHNLKYVLK